MATPHENNIIGGVDCPVGMENDIPHLFVVQHHCTTLAYLFTKAALNPLKLIVHAVIWLP